MFSAAAHAGPAVPQGDEIAHTVQEGDTLEGLARAYLDAPRQWPLLQARNKVANPRRLQPGSVVWIPVRLQPAESATVAFVHGQVTAQARPGDAPVPVAKGGKLDEGTALHVGPDAFVAVEPQPAGTPDYFGKVYVDSQGQRWQEINLQTLSQYSPFLSISG